MAVALYALFALPLLAQQNGNLPTLIQGTGDETISNGYSVLGTNHLITGMLAWDSSSACPMTGTLSDSSGILASITMGTTICVTNGSNNQAFDPQLVMTPFYGVSSGSGALSLSTTTPGHRLQYVVMGEYSLGNNLTFDAQATPSGKDRKSVV